MKSFFTRVASANKRPWALLFVFGAFLLLMKTLSIPGSAQSPSAPPDAQSRNERVLENAIPENVPLSVKIKKGKERSFRALTNEKWIREFELELTNTGTKPIYFIYMYLQTDVKYANGDQISFPLSYGRVELGRIRVKAGPGDVPIGPGESAVFVIHPSQVREWEKFQPAENRPQPKKLRVEFQILSFGDGTGFILNTPIPNTWNKRSALRGCEIGPNKGSPNLPEWLNAEFGRRIKKSEISYLPVGFLPVNFCLQKEATCLDQTRQIVAQPLNVRRSLHIAK